MEIKRRYTLKKEERLHGFKLIEKLFNDGKSFLVYPYKVVFMENSESSEFPFNFGVTASKRNFRSAVDRNKIKRLSREAYRKNKHILYDSSLSDVNGLSFMMIYIGREILSYDIIESKIILILRRLSGDDEKGI